MRLTRRGKTLVVLVIVSLLALHPITQSKAVAPVKDPKKAVFIWSAYASKAHAKSRLADYGWSATEFICLKDLWTKESNWRSAAQNKNPVTQIRNGKRVALKAGGIPQILGLDPKLPVPQQIRRGLDYIDSRYGTPCAAWSFWKRKAGHDLRGGWY